MPRLIVVVASLVAVAYALLPLLIEGQTDGRVIETLGHPWTFNEFLGKLREEGVELNIEPQVVDRRSNFGEEAMRVERLVVSGTSDGISVLVFPTVAERRRAWPDDGGPRTLTGGSMIIEAHSIQAENVVLVVGFTQRDPGSPTLSEIRNAMQSIGRR